ncbi:DUF3632 domain-containing protein [Lentzea albidocapillata]|uniref:Uncharacterized protein n=1 Tax=Lentzea albidocapillata TaxID=40571 RepID=A0A1W2FTH8_9PSEU|nr:DUF3632 domain-containing protein [Lentzea albidocapillata]SMD25225.1 Protein of unknown function [Lentzea albidocapillata]
MNTYNPDGNKLLDYETAFPYYTALVREYLSVDQELPLERAVTKFVGPIRSAFVDHRRPAEDDVEGILWQAARAVLQAACAPRDSPAALDRVHGRLAFLMKAVKDQGDLVREPGQEQCRLWGWAVFTDLPVFSAEMREEFDRAAFAPDAAVRFPLYNAFAARLTAIGVDFALYAIWTIRDCLEEESPGLETLPAAVPWFVHCSGLLHSLARRSGALLDYSAPKADLGALAVQHGLTIGGFTIERWEFWRSRLEEIAAGSDSAGDVAAVAVRHMRSAADGWAESSRQSGRHQ